MQEGREEVRRDNVYESNGARNSGGFSPFGFGRNMMMPSLFGGRDPFDDPFFSDPFGSMRGPSFASRAMQNTSRDKGVVIQELGSDDEGTNTSFPQTGEPSVEHPDDDDDDHVNSNIFILFLFCHFFNIFGLTCSICFINLCTTLCYV